MVGPEAALLRTAIGLAPEALPTAADFSIWLELARSHRVIPLLHQLVWTADSQLDEERFHTSHTAQIDVMAAAVRLEHHLLEVSEVLEAGGIELAVLKGMATAHLDYDDPAQRQFGDVDLLVSPSRFARACSVLEAHGWNVAYVLPRHHERYTHAITFRRPDGLEVDLHQRIAHRGLGLRIPTDALLAASIEVTIAGHRVRALSGTDRLIHAAIHAVASRGSYRRLSGVADVLVLAERLADESEAVLGRASDWRIAPLVQKAIADAYASAALPLPEVWARGTSAHQRRDRLLEHAYLAEHRRAFSEELAHLRLLPGWRDRGAYLGGYFALDADYADRKRRHDLPAQVRYLWSRLRGDRGSRSAS